MHMIGSRLQQHPPHNSLINDKSCVMFVGMAKKNPSPLQTSFWLTEQEKRYILVICSIFLLGLIARYWYLKHEKLKEYIPKGIEKLEQSHE